MSEQELFDSYLLLLKSNVEVYVHGTLESSNQTVRDLLKTCLDDTMDMQGCTYMEMADRGWYEITDVKSQEIEKVLNKVKEN